MNNSVIIRAVLTAVLSFCIVSGTSAASSAKEIRSALVGNTFKGSMGSDVYSSYFAEEGTYEDAYGGGKYKITDEGVCYPGTEYGCYAAEIDGNKLEWFKNGDSAGTGAIEQGNTLK